LMISSQANELLRFCGDENMKIPNSSPLNPHSKQPPPARVSSSF
jgi:hypothetical protein